MRVTSTNQTGSSQGSSPVADAELAAQQAQRAAAEAARLAASQNGAAGQAQAAAQRAMELLKKAQAALTEAKKQKAPAAELNRAEQAIAKANAATQQAAASLRATSTFEPGRTPPPAAQSPQSTPPQATPAQSPPATAGQPPPPAAAQGPTPGYTQEQAAKDAAEIYGATKGGLTGWGTDEDRLFKALDNKSPADIALIRQSFKEHYNLDLDQTVRKELDGDDLTRANNILSGNKGAAAAATFKGQTGWFGDQEGSLKQLEAASPADRRAIAQSFQQMYAKDYPDVKASTPEEFMQKALGPSLNDSQKSQLQSLLATTQAGTPAEVAQLEAGAARTKAKDALEGFWGADSQKVFDTLKGLPADEKKLLLADAGFQADLEKKLSKEDFARAKALLEDKPAAASAAQISSATQGWFGADKSAIIDTLKSTKPEDLPALKAEYQKQNNRSLEDEVKSWGGADSQVALSYLNPPAADDKAGRAKADAQRLFRAMDGVGTDETAIREVLGSKSKAQIGDITNAYRDLYKRDLRSDLSSELSGRDKFELVDQAYDLGAIDPKAPDAAQQQLDRLKAQRQFEQSSGMGLIDGLQHLTKGESDADRLDRNLAASEAAIASGDTQAANRRLGFATDDVKALQETKDSAADMASTAAVAVVTTAAVVATGGAATPLAIAGYAALGAGTRVGTQWAFKGDSLGSEGLLQQGALGMVEGATAAIPVPKGLGGAGTALTEGAEQVAKRTALQQMGNAARQGAWSGMVQGAATGATDQATQSETWRNGLMPGLAQVGKRAVTDGAVGMAFGAGGGAAMDGLMQGGSRLVKPREVPVTHNPHLEGDTTLVRYDNGRVHIQAGPQATAENIAAHMETARALQKYEGPLGGIRRLRDRIDSALTGRPGYGTQGFESQLEVKKLTGIRAELENTRVGIEKRIEAMGGKTDAATSAERAALEKEIANIEDQLATHAALVDSLDAGRGFVAAHESAGATEAAQLGYPKLPSTEHPNLHWRLRDGQLDVVNLGEGGPQIYNPKTGGFEPNPGAKELKFDKGVGREAAYKALGGDKPDSAFGKFVNQLEKEGLTTREELIQKMQDPSALNYRTVRSNLKEPYRKALLDRVTDPGRLESSEIYKAAIAAKKSPEEALRAASHAEMLRVTKNLDSADKGSLAEAWYAKVFGGEGDEAGRFGGPRAGEKHIGITQKEAGLQGVELKQDRVLDRVEGGTIRELKNVSGKFGDRELSQIGDDVKLVGKKVVVNGEERTMERVAVEMLDPDGVRANAEAMKKLLQKSPSDRLVFELYNSLGERMTVSKATLGKLEEPALSEFLSGRVTK